MQEKNENSSQGMKTRMRKGEIARVILTALVGIGVLTVVAAAPGAAALLKYSSFGKPFSSRFRQPKERRKFSNTFYYLKKRRMIRMEYRGKQLHISLTKKGKKLAKKYQIDALRIQKPKRWDHQWRILIFDIPEKAKVKREALRGKLKELGLFQLQKSVWVCPYDFQKEMNILREFLALKGGQMSVIVASEIEDDHRLRTFFGLV